VIFLRPLNAQNWQDAAGLEVNEDQMRFIETNLYSIAESRFHSELQPMAIFENRTMVGFLMWGVDSADRQPWLYRFMVDRRFQGKGRGKAALERLLSMLRKAGHRQLDVGFHPENLAAERLYLGAGFTPTGTAPWGEKTARLTF
jgi:diamine N-acetyltransferase